MQRNAPGARGQSADVRMFLRAVSAAPTDRDGWVRRSAAARSCDLTKVAFDRAVDDALDREWIECRLDAKAASLRFRLTPDARAEAERQEEPSEEAHAVPLSEVVEEPVDWLWPGWLPRGRLTLVAGEPGAGKSWMTLAMAAAVSAGGRWPDGTVAEQGPSLLLSLEDGHGDTVRPRAAGMGATLENIHVFRGIGEDDRLPVLPDDIDILRRLVLTLKPSLVVLDPLVAVQNGAVDPHQQAAMRTILQPLHRFAAQSGAAVIVVAHLRKSASDFALHRVGGSIDLTAVPRVVIAVGRDPENPARRGVAILKNNLSAWPEPRAFELEGGALRWDSQAATDLDADRLFGPRDAPEDRGALAAAEGFLRDLLDEGRVEATEGRRQAKEAGGFSGRTLDTAKRNLGVASKRDGATWFWLPPTKPPQ